MAGATAALPHAPDSLAVETFGVTLRRYQELNTLRAELEIRAQQALAANADFAHLETLPGIGPPAMTILAEGGNLRRFGHHRQFPEYCGLDRAKSQLHSPARQEQSRSAGTHGYVWHFRWRRSRPRACLRTPFARNTTAILRPAPDDAAIFAAKP